MANNSDIIKIGFDYESGLAEFIKNYNGTMDQVQKSADGNRIEIQFDVSDKDVMKKISSIQGDFKNVKIELNGKELTQQLSSIEAIKDVLISIIKMVNDGTKIDSILNLDKTFSQVDDLKKQISDLKSSMEKMHTDNDIAEAWNEGFRVGGEELEHFRESALESTDVIFKLRKELENLQAENQQLAGSKDYFKGIIDILSRSVDESESKIVELQKRLETLLKAGSETNISTPKNTTSGAAGASADDSKVSIEGEADKLKETAQNATEAANAKLKFVDANKKVKDSAKDSADAVQGESDSFKNVNTDPYSTYVQNVYKAWQQADKINDALSETQQKFQSIENTFGKSTTGGSRFEELFPGVTAQIKTLDNELTQGNRTLKSYASAIDKLLVKNPESFLKNSESAIQKAEKSLNNLTVPSNLTSEFSNVKTEVESLNEQLKNNKISISDYKQSVSEKISDFGSAIKEQKTALEKTLSEMNTLIGKVDYNVKTGKPVDGMRSSDYSTMMDKYKAELEELRTLQATVSKQDYVSAAQLKQFDDLRKKLKDSETSFKTLSAAEKGSDSLSRAKLYSKIGEYLQKNSGMAKEFKTQLKSLQKQLENDGPNANVKNLTDQFIRLQSQIREAGQEGRSFLDVLKDKAFYGFVGQLSTYFGFNDFVRYIGEGINTVRELDTAMTEMRKVSDESVTSLKNFQKESFNIANAVGTTALQIQNSTADWMRLGLGIEDAKEAAKDANILLNVSEFDNIEDATKSLVSMSQAYKDLDKLTIVDKLNEVGNNYAISTDELASALQRSSATLSLMGNTIDEAAALVTTANATIQDADSVAAGLRTISLRLVGTSEAEEELSAMNEEVDAFVKATNSKKQQIIKDYTAVASNQYKGFDILDDNGNYKNTYEILLGIAKVYKEIQEQDKKLGTNHAMALIEELAGKNRSNIASAILQDPKQLEEVLKSSQEANGSALEELNKQLESVDGRIQKLQNRMQEFWATVIDTDTVKTGISLLTDLVSGATALVDKLGTLPTALGALGAALSVKNVGGRKMFRLLNMPTA